MQPRPFRPTLLILILCALLAPACTSSRDATQGPPAHGAETPEATRQLERELGEALRGMEEAMRRNDLAAVAAFYRDDCVLLSPGGSRTTGREAIDAYWARFGTGIDWKLEPFATEGNYGRGFAYQRGRSTLTYERDGELRTSTVEFVLLWRRDNLGDWRIAVDGYW